MTSKGLFWIWLGPLAWMAILMLVASGRADEAGTESVEVRRIESLRRSRRWGDESGHEGQSECGSMHGSGAVERGGCVTEVESRRCRRGGGGGKRGCS